MEALSGHPPWCIWFKGRRQILRLELQVDPDWPSPSIESTGMYLGIPSMRVTYSSLLLTHVSLYLPHLTPDNEFDKWKHGNTSLSLPTRPSISTMKCRHSLNQFHQLGNWEQTNLDAPEAQEGEARKVRELLHEKAGVEVFILSTVSIASQWLMDVSAFEDEEELCTGLQDWWLSRPDEIRAHFSPSAIACGLETIRKIMDDELGSWNEPGDDQNTPDADGHRNRTDEAANMLGEDEITINEAGGNHTAMTVPRMDNPNPGQTQIQSVRRSTTPRQGDAHPGHSQPNPIPIRQAQADVIMGREATRTKIVHTPIVEAIRLLTTLPEGSTVPLHIPPRDKPYLLCEIDRTAAVETLRKLGWFTQTSHRHERQRCLGCSMHNSAEPHDIGHTTRVSQASSRLMHSPIWTSHKFLGNYIQIENRKYHINLAQLLHSSKSDATLLKSWPARRR
ncbi:hypothetical protein ACRALDRAFT_206708 [Sodiomyces alcalophilus JCM 7366]|uniref:uncharacterized protein n=1 Tax=Sodiomyces alcalophilus JCM 7366 TaxID=591952 RepID=UPI0039B65199